MNNLTRLPLALTFVIIGFGAATTGNSSLALALFYLGMGLGLLFGIYGVVLTFQKKRSWWWSATDIIALGVVAFYAWLFYLAMQAFSHRIF